MRWILAMLASSNSLFLLLAATHSRGLTIPGIHLHFGLQAVLALLAGILILVRPKALNFIVAAYLIAIGVIGILGLRFW